MTSSLMIILIGVSGAGKSTLRDYAIHRNTKIKKLIAVTDRPPRTTELNGIDKFFVSSSEFRVRESNGKLCLINRIYGHMYAFRKLDFESDDIYLGELHYKNLNEFLEFHPNTKTIYIKPQEIDKVLEGLHSRGSSKNEICVRQTSMLSEVKELDNLDFQGLFDYTFINCFTEKSKQDFCNLIDMLILEEVTK